MGYIRCMQFGVEKVFKVRKYILERNLTVVRSVERLSHRKVPNYSGFSTEQDHVMAPKMII